MRIEADRVKPALQPTAGALEFHRLYSPAQPSVPFITFYIRLVTLRADNTMVGTPSKAAILRYGERLETIINYYGDPNAPEMPAKPEKTNNPAFEIAEYRPFHRDLPGWPYHFIITRDYELPFSNIKFKKGEKVYWPPDTGDDGIFEKVSDAVGSVVDFAEKAVTAVSDAYSSIKSGVLEFTADHLPGCGEKCRAGLSFAMDYGLASLGIPPSIPNFDDLKDMGKDYVIQYAAEQSGLPAEEAARAVEKYFEGIDNAASGGGWYKLDTSYQYSDAMLLLDVWNPTDEPTAAGTIVVSQPATGRLFALPLNKPEDGGWSQAGTAMGVPIPVLAPRARIQVPIMMTPNLIWFAPGGMLQDQWYEMAAKGVLLEVRGSWYGDNKPTMDLINVQH